MPTETETYPWAGQFETEKQLADYFSGARLTCLLCGKTFLQLGHHLVRGHGVSVDDYRIRFGIPSPMGLFAPPLREMYRAKGERLSRLTALLTHEELSARAKLGVEASNRAFGSISAVSKARMSANGRRAVANGVLKPPKPRLSPEQKAIIKATPKTVSNRDLGRQYGVHCTTIVEIRGPRGPNAGRYSRRRA